MGVASRSDNTDLPKPGTLVHVRQRNYLVERVELAPSPNLASVIHLSCIDDDNQGAPLSVFWETEVDKRVLDGDDWSHIAKKGFDDPTLFSAYLHTLRWNTVTATDPKLFQAPFRAGIKIEAYQLEPLRRALEMPRVNLFIADDVGLGKTIEAGLIIRELMLRKKARFIVVAAPPSMLPQWQSELENRFGLSFQILDRNFVRETRQERGYAVNPWMTHTKFLISHKLLIDENYIGPLRALLGEFEAGTVFVLDEAHHAAPASGSKYAIDTRITNAVRDLSKRFEHRLFLSATPHNGHSNSFSALLEILDSQRFIRGVPVNPKNVKTVLVRRIKEDLRELEGGFPKRVVKAIRISGLPSDSAELRLPELLDRYAQLREERLDKAPRRTQIASGLVITHLQQRLLSSVEAFVRTLRVHCRGLQKENVKAGISGDVDFKTLDLLGKSVNANDERADLAIEELESEVDAQLELASSIEATFEKNQIDLERDILAQMTQLAEAHRGQPDAKIKAITSWIRDNMCPGLPMAPLSTPSGAPWKNTRVIIFTEWDDTKRYIYEQLQVLVAGTDQGNLRIAVYHGPTPPAKREEIKRAFNEDPAVNPLRILIATDAAREGLNLQSQCHNLFHFDIPWNPSRMEQRNGRIDRKLQPSPEVYCHYFEYEQRKEDQILIKIIEKSETVRRELGSMAEVVDVKIHETLSSGIRHGKIEQHLALFEDDENECERKRTVDEELESSRERQAEIRQQIDRLRTQLQRSREWINITEDSFREAISASLRLQQALPLEPIADSSNDVKTFTFPRIDQGRGASPSWATTLDSLRKPKKSDESYQEWRKQSPIRPIVFQDPGLLDDSVVHLHLEHRVSQRLLGRFLAQGFTAYDLARACYTQANDSIPRVVLLGRIALFGANAARLHEEIISVTARWHDPEDRKGKLKPYAEDAERKTLDILETSLINPPGKLPPAKIMSRLQAAVAQDVKDLLSHLYERAESISESAGQELRKRGIKEADDMRAILEDQKKQIESQISRQFPQDNLSMLRQLDPNEARQLESDRKHWIKRLASLQTELKEEPKRVAAAYEIKASRVEPVGIVYLWPQIG
ncbi:DISARM system SNF2-like helicase DrmD [Oligoflexus tunisiensis]|uniref:DISARM system SNF2-like helicase DrmD n=1 Tax=Oligoflexus tunisiensis TaxID=708132 RepID=UPI000AA2E565|nr:DISARM system SNF2-like helicase DrmD [Oligoflexus tunisiensis]